MPQNVAMTSFGMRSARVLWLGILFITLIVSPLAAQYTDGAFATRSFGGRNPLRVKYSVAIPPSVNVGVGVAKVSISDVAGPSSKDRNLTVVLYVKNWGTDTNSIAYRQSMRLAEGQTTTQLEIPFTSAEGQLYWDVGVFEDGRDIEDTRNRRNDEATFQWANNYVQARSLDIACLIASDVDAKIETENVKALTDLLDARIKSTTGQFPQVGAVGGTTFNPNSIVPVTTANRDWRLYLPYSVWLASASALGEISDKQPEVASALRTYVSAGGVLFVYDVATPESLSQVSRLMSAEGVDKLDLEKQSWKYFGKEPAPGMGSEPSRTEPSWTTGKEVLAKLSDGDMFAHEYARGQFIVCTKPPRLASTNQLEKFLDNIGQPVCGLANRDKDGSWFWQNLIITVGKPPVWAFCVIVALFGALLGPGLLIFTGRMKRRSLMIFLVPAVSAVATLLIVLYGVFHEGFDTHLRIRSVTSYDGPSRIAFSWSRQNYFSGLPPRDGLQFPIDAYVRSVEADDAQSYSGSPDPRTSLGGTVTLGEKQSWSNWLKPRQHQQMLVGQRVAAGTIPISTEKDETGALLLNNLTTSILPLVVLRGGQDDYYLATVLEPHESRRCQSQDRDSLAAVVSRVGADYRPRIPVELEGGSDSLMNFGNSRRYARSNTYQVDDIILQAFKRYLSGELRLEPYGFSAIVPEFNAIKLPMEGKQSDNTNLVIGVEPW